MKCSSRHTLTPTLDSTFCTPQIHTVLASGVPREARDRSQQGRPNSLLSVVCAPFSQLGWWRPEAQLPSIREEAQLLTTQEWSQSARGRPNCLSASSIPVVVGFSLTSQNPEYMGPTSKFQWSGFVAHFPIFSHTKLLLLLLFRIIFLGVNNNFCV